jgi:hypothetical protein
MAPAFAVVERVASMPKQGVASTFNFGASYGAVRSVLAALLIPTHLIAPAVWKKHFRLDSDKEKARALALRLLAASQPAPRMRNRRPARSARAGRGISSRARRASACRRRGSSCRILAVVEIGTDDDGDPAAAAKALKALHEITALVAALVAGELDPLAVTATVSILPILPVTGCPHSARIGPIRLHDIDRPYHSSKGKRHSYSRPDKPPSGVQCAIRRTECGAIPKLIPTGVLRIIIFTGHPKGPIDERCRGQKYFVRCGDA